MRVGIVGAGKIGANLARQWSRRGHDILLSYKRDAKQLEALASGLGARWGTPRGAAAHGQVVLLATPWSILDDLADRVSLAVTIVIDATNPFVAGALAQLACWHKRRCRQRPNGSPARRWSKAFNTYTSRFQAAVGNGEHGHPVAMFVSGEDSDARQIAQILVRRLRTRRSGWTSRDAPNGSAPPRGCGLWRPAARMQPDESPAPCLQT